MSEIGRAKSALKKHFPSLTRVIGDLFRVVSGPFRARFLINSRKRALLRREFQEFMRMSAEVGDTRFELAERENFFIFGEGTSQTGFDAHYLYHTSWAARLLSQNRPSLHHDFASDIRFATLVSAFVPMVFYDYRPLLVDLSDLRSERADLLNLQIASESVRSLSCMHVIEHIGLGRYGDPVDPSGDLKAIKALKRILAPGGDIYFVVPIGQPVLRFNAHRIYSYDMIMGYFSDYALKDFSLVTDEGTFIPHADRGSAEKQGYGCGCFWFRK